jgi:hypothetical protein
MSSSKQTKQNEVVPLLTSRAALTKLPGALSVSFRKCVKRLAQEHP